MEENKPFWQSKTIWVNVVATLGTVFGINEFTDVDLQAEVAVAIVAIVNIVLRFVTKTPITIK